MSSLTLQSRGLGVAAGLPDSGESGDGSDRHRRKAAIHDEIGAR